MDTRKDDIADMLDLAAKLLLSAAEENGVRLERAIPASSFFTSLGRAFRERNVRFVNEAQFWKDVEDYAR